MEGDRLLAVEQGGEVEVAEVDAATAAEHDAHRGKGPLGGVSGVLGGELEFEARRVGCAGADAEGVEQAVLRRPADGVLRSDGSDGVRV